MRIVASKATTWNPNQYQSVSGWKHSVGQPLWAFSRHVCKIYICKMYCIQFWVSLLVFGLNILIFTKLMIFNIIWIFFCKSLNSRNIEYIYGIYSIIEPISILDYTRIGFELISQKKFEMKNLKTHFTYLLIFHLKVIVCQNVNLPHTYGHNPQKHPFVIW
jgi:hypothetical protein